MLNSVNYGFQTQEKAQEYNRRVAEEAYARKYNFFNNVYNPNIPHYLQNRGGMKVGGKHPATLFGEIYDPQVNFTYRRTNIDVYGQKGMDMYQMPQHAFEKAMQFVDPNKINTDTKTGEAIKRGIVDYHKKNERAYYDPNVNLKAQQLRRELSFDDKKFYYDNERRNVENPYDVETSNRIKSNRRLNEIMPKQRQNLKDYSELYPYNHSNDGNPFFDGNQYKYQYGDEPVWGAKNQGNFDHKIDKNTAEYKGDPNYAIRELEEQRRKYWANRNVAYGKANKFNPKDIYESMVPYYDDIQSMYNKQFKPGIGDKFNIDKEKNVNIFRGKFNNEREYSDNYDAKTNDNEQVFWKNNYDQRQYQGFNGKANYLYNDGRFLVGVKDKMNRPYNAFAGNQWAYKENKHIINDPYAPLKNQLSDFNGKNTINYHRYY